MASLIPILTATPASPAGYNFGMAETFSWIPIKTPSRPLFARTVFSVNNKDNEGQSGFDFIQPGILYANNYICIQTINSTVIEELTAINSDFGTIGGGTNTNIFQTTLPADFKLRAEIKGIKLTSGAAIAYK